MKVFFAVFGMFVCSLGMAGDNSYRAKKIDCRGTINNSAKTQVHSSYHKIGIRLLAFKAKRRDGSLADSLGWNTYYGSFEQISAKMAANKGGSEVWYSDLLQQRLTTTKGLQVYGRNFTLTLRGRKDGKAYFSGHYSRPDSPAGSYYYNLSCIAIE